MYIAHLFSRSPNDAPSSGLPPSAPKPVGRYTPPPSHSSQLRHAKWAHTSGVVKLGQSLEAAGGRSSGAANGQSTGHSLLVATAGAWGQQPAEAQGTQPAGAWGRRSALELRQFGVPIRELLE
jgi:hypothetical protein